MLPLTLTFLLFTLLTPTLSAPPPLHSTIHCPIILDGRIPQNFTLPTFNTPASPYNPDYSKGQNLSWSQILTFPHSAPSRFDPPLHKPVEVSISDSSLFLPGGGQLQVGFRRAGLLLGNGSDASNAGVRTFHWSVKQDPARAMNLSHEYMNVWHEANDYASNQFSLNTGVMLAQDNPKNGTKDSTRLDRRLWKVLDRGNDVVWTGRIAWGEWENFAVTLDVEGGGLQVYHSVGYAPLKAVTGRLPVDNSGGGQFQIGMLKKPTETTSVVFDGYQESGIHEGQIYGGIFVEDSQNGCLSR